MVHFLKTMTKPAKQRGQERKSEDHSAAHNNSKSVRVQNTTKTVKKKQEK